MTHNNTEALFTLVTPQQEQLISGGSVPLDPRLLAYKGQIYQPPTQALPQPLY